MSGLSFWCSSTPLPYALPRGAVPVHLSEYLGTCLGTLCPTLTSSQLSSSHLPCSPPLCPISRSCFRHPHSRRFLLRLERHAHARARQSCLKLFNHRPHCNLQLPAVPDAQTETGQSVVGTGIVQLSPVDLGHDEKASTILFPSRH